MYELHSDHSLVGCGSFTCSILVGWGIVVRLQWRIDQPVFSFSLSQTTHGKTCFLVGWLGRKHGIDVGGNVDRCRSVVFEMEQSCQYSVMWAILVGRTDNVAAAIQSFDLLSK